MDFVLKKWVKFREMGHQKGNRLVSKEHDETTRPIFHWVNSSQPMGLFAGAKLRFRFQPCFYETRNPGIKRLSINFCSHSFISRIGRYTCFIMPNLRLYRLPTAVCQKPNFSLIPYLILVSYRTKLTFHIKSHPSPHVMSSHIASSPPHLLQTFSNFHHVFNQPFQSEKITLPLLGNQENPQGP